MATPSKASKFEENIARLHAAAQAKVPDAMHEQKKKKKKW